VSVTTRWRPKAAAWPELPRALAAGGERRSLRAGLLVGAPLLVHDPAGVAGLAMQHCDAGLAHLHQDTLSSATKS
jgi:hypothetical protein